MKKKTYTAPVLEVLEAKVEKGFSASGSATSQQMEGLHETENNYGNELFS